MVAMFWVNTLNFFFSTGDTLQYLINKVLSGAKAKFRHELVLESTLGYIYTY